MRNDIFTIIVPLAHGDNNAGYIFCVNIFFFCSVLFCFVSFCFYFNREMIVSTNGGAASDGGTNRNREER